MIFIDNERDLIMIGDKLGIRKLPLANVLGYRPLLIRLLIKDNHEYRKLV